MYLIDGQMQRSVKLKNKLSRDCLNQVGNDASPTMRPRERPRARSMRSHRRRPGWRSIHMPRHRSMNFVWFYVVYVVPSLSCGCFCRRQLYTTCWFIDKTRCSRRFLFVSYFFTPNAPLCIFYTNPVGCVVCLYVFQSVSLLVCQQWLVRLVFLSMQISCDRHAPVNGFGGKYLDTMLGRKMSL